MTEAHAPGLVTLVGWAHSAANLIVPQLVSVWQYDYDVLALELTPEAFAEGRRGLLHGEAYWALVAAAWDKALPIDLPNPPGEPHSLERIEARDDHMASHLIRLAQEGKRVLHLVGYLHLPELKCRLRAAGVQFTAIHTAEDASRRVTMEGVTIGPVPTLDLGAVLL